MADIDRMLRAALDEHADEAPEGRHLLGGVHARSRQLRRRRRAVTSAGLAVVTVAIGLPAAAGVLGGGRPAPGPAHELTSPPATSAPAVTGATASPPSPAASASSGQSHPASGGQQLRPVAATFRVPTMPYQLASATASRYRQPVTTMQSGALVAYYAAKDGVRDADVTLVVTGQRPSFGTPAAQVTESGQQVRSKQGTLRTVALRPAAQLVLYWQESATQWIQLRTDDTYQPDEVAAMANALLATPLALDVPLHFDLAPAGMGLQTVTPYGMNFQPTGGGGVVACTVVAPRTPSGSSVQVGGYQGVLVRTATGAVLTVAVTDWKVSLLVEVPAAYQVSDADLIRFAAGVRVLDRAETREASADGIGAPIT